MKRTDIEEKYKWDLTSIYKNDQEFYDDIKTCTSLLEELSQFEGKLTLDIENFISFLTKRDEMSMLVNKAYCFAHLNCDVEPENQEYQKMLATVMTLLQQASVKLVYVDNEICKHDQIIKTYLEDERLKDYRYSISNILSYKPHLLDDQQEMLVAKMDNIADTSEQVFDSLRLDFEDVEVNGKKKTLNQATLSQFLKNKDVNVRKDAYHKFFKEYKKFENTFALTLSGVMKKDAFYSDIRHFETPLEASVFNDDVPSSLFFKILEKANHQYRYLFHRYNRLKKELLKIDDFYNYDLNIPLVKSISRKYTIDECFDIINQALAPFGEEYLNIISQAREKRWIDYYPTDHKRGGAYSSGSYLTQPYILMNFIGDYDSLSTLIHELGHSVHTYLSSANQSFVNSNYRIFVAEVASTVNETLLINYMIDHAQTNEEKRYFIYEQLENCVGLIFRQPMFADFEHKLHMMAQNNEPMSSQTITDLYAKLNQEYFGDDVKLDELVGWSCYYVPHFYYDYYVYKYTLGMTVALAIVKRILANDHQQTEKYLNFLKSGGKESPVDLLKHAGVDPLDDAIYDDAFKYFEELLNEFENLSK
ncbi:oligoendopeptidase F [[Clostridium] spiroforme]|nr:oligoendopeptidase F [Thomasclavelia spiroformis]